MNSIFISVMAVFVLMKQSQANHHDNNNNNDLIRVTQLYDAFIDLITYKHEDHDCQTRINNLRGLLDDSLSNCYAGSANCMDKDSFISGAKTHCNQYKDVENHIRITKGSNADDSSISLSAELIHKKMDNCQMTKTYDAEITYNTEGLITKVNVVSEAKESQACPDANNDRKKHIDELNNKMSNMACKSKADKVDDYDIKNKFCVNMEYEAKCNNYNKCGKYAGKLEGRDSFLDLVGEYQDMFDDTTVTLEDGTFLVKYRKGLCSGDYKLRVDIDYDEDNQCISKWTDHWDDLVISDRDCDDSNDKWVNKMMTQCKFDDEGDDEYTTDAPRLVKRERGNILH